MSEFLRVTFLFDPQTLPQS